MEILAAIGSYLTTGASGGVLGVLGSLAGGWIKSKAAVVELEAEKARWAHQLALMKAQAEMKAADADHASLTAAIRAEGRTNSNVPEWVAAVKALWRPALSLLLLIISSVIILLLATGDLPVAEGTRGELLDYSVRTLLFLTSTAIAFWFGARSVGMKDQR